MGEMADWVNDNGEIEELLYGYGGTKSCRCCGKDGLHWVNSGTRRNTRWLLADSLGIHQCKVNPLKGDE